jgi:hypothetical protein
LRHHPPLSITISVVLQIMSSNDEVEVVIS